MDGKGQIRPRHLFFVFLIVFRNVGLAYVFAIVLLQFLYEPVAEQIPRLILQLQLAVIFASVAGVLMVLLVAIWARIVKFEYSGAWKDFRKKVRFFQLYR